MNTFFLKTLLHLGSQLTLTGLTAINTRTTKISNKWMWFIISICLYFAMRKLNHNIPIHIRIVMFCLFSILNGIILSTFLKYLDPVDIKSALFYTVFVFITMTSIGFIIIKRNIDVTPLVLCIAMYSVTMIIMYVYMIFFDTRKQTKQYFKMASIALMAFYIVFDTYNNFEKDYKNDIIVSTLDYYTDIVTIFQNMLSYFSNQ